MVEVWQGRIRRRSSGFTKPPSRIVAPAQFNLGNGYYGGHGSVRNDREAVKWYRKAAEQNDAEAEKRLGVCYYKGDGVTKDSVEAMRWYHTAAEQNLVTAQHNLGFRYAKGDGVPKDDIQAYKWLSLASSHGDELAKRSLLPAVEERMTPEQIAEAQQLVREFTRHRQ